MLNSMTADTQRWRSVVGFDGLYEVSSRGDVRSIPRLDRMGRRNRSGRILKPGRDKKGYLFVGLCKDGKQVTRRVHTLVLEAFAGTCPPGQQCRHLDGNPGNNCWPENICWGTASEDRRDQVRIGTHKESRKTRCVNDHLLAGDNLRIDPVTGARECRACARDSQRRCRRDSRPQQA